MNLQTISSWEDGLSVRAKLNSMLSDMTVGEEGLNEVWNKLNKLSSGVASLEGHFYGFYNTTLDLPTSGENGYAYLATTATNEYQIWTFKNAVWENTGIVKTVTDYNSSRLKSLLLCLTSGDYLWREGQDTIATIVARVVRGDTTLTVPPSLIGWSRESSATGTEDADWAARHPNIDNTLTVTEADMVGDVTTFVCTLYDENGNVAAAKAITI